MKQAGRFEKSTGAPREAMTYEMYPPKERLTPYRSQVKS